MFLLLSDVKMKVLKNTDMLASLAQERADEEGAFRGKPVSTNTKVRGGRLGGGATKWPL